MLRGGKRQEREEMDKRSESGRNAGGRSYRRKPEKVARDAALAQLYAQGASQGALARQFALSRARVQQIVSGVAAHRSG